MTPEEGNPSRRRGCSTRPPAAVPTGSCTCCRDWWPRATSRGSASPASIVEDGVPVGVEREGVVLAPDRLVGARRRQRRRRGPAHHVDRRARPARHDLRRVRAARPAHRDRRLDRPARVATARPGAVRLRRRARHRPEPVPQQGHGVLPRTGHRAGRRAQLRRAAPADVGPRRDQGRSGRASCRPASPIRGSRSGSATCPSTRSRRICPPSRCGVSTGSSRARSIPSRSRRSAAGRRRCGCRRAGCCCTTA